MSAAKIAASLRSTGWTGTLSSFPSEYSDGRDRRATFQAQIVTARSHGTRSSAFRRRGLPGGAGHEGQLRVDSGPSPEEEMALEVEGIVDGGMDAQKALPPRDRKFADSPLEGSGFELLVPLLAKGSGGCSRPGTLAR